MGTFVTGLLVFGAAGLALRKIIRDKKNGKSNHCGGDCARCRGCR